jgi:ABC-type phosphate transport system substrate-binding protein
MKRNVRALGLLALAVLGLLAVGGVTAGAASADCRMLAAAEPNGKWEDSACTKSTNPGRYALVTGAGVSLGSGTYCFKVAKAEETSAWKDSKCSEAKAGKGEFVKVNVCLFVKPLLGQGSTLQKLAQVSIWSTSTNCEVTYQSTGSAAGLKAFGVGKTESPKSSKDDYIGTDDAPNATQLGEMETQALAGAGATEKQDLVIPVAQAAIAMLVHPPKGCEISQITNVHLEEVWRGALKLWNKIATNAPGETCTGEITRVVRKDGSGTTYQFKHYLFEINQAELAGTTPKRKWTGLQEEEKANLEWPEEAGVLSPVVHATNSGGGGEVEEVSAKEGSVGYASLTDARSKFVAKKLFWLKVENSAGGTTKFVNPGTSGTEPSVTAAKANCGGTTYTGTIPTAGKVDGDWSNVYGGNPGAGPAGGENTTYPICTLTWDVALVGYKQAGLTAEEGTNTWEYLRWVLGTNEFEGQKEVANNHDYGALPTGSAPDVLKNAQETEALVGSRP